MHKLPKIYVKMLSRNALTDDPTWGIFIAKDILMFKLPYSELKEKSTPTHICYPFGCDRDFAMQIMADIEEMHYELEETG